MKRSQTFAEETTRKNAKTVVSSTTKRAPNFDYITLVFAQKNEHAEALDSLFAMLRKKITKQDCTYLVYMTTVGYNRYSTYVDTRNYLFTNKAVALREAKEKFIKMIQRWVDTELMEEIGEKEYNPNTLDSFDEQDYEELRRMCECTVEVGHAGGPSSVSVIELSPPPTKDSEFLQTVLYRHPE